VGEWTASGEGCAASAGMVCVRAAAAMDDRGVIAHPAEILLCDGRIVSVGTDRRAAGGDSDGGARPYGDAVRMVELPDCVVIPGLINAHTHLDLTAIGPVAIPSGETTDERFGGWLAAVRAARLTEPRDVRASVTAGVTLARRGGTAFVADIAGGRPDDVIETLRASAMAGMAFAEVFGLGSRQAAAMESVTAMMNRLSPEEGGFRVGLQPHALYSAGPALFRHCAAESARLGYPMATHLGESEGERLFARDAAGPLADRLQAMGVWNAGIRPWGDDPIPAVLREAGAARLLAVHVNDVTPGEIELLAERGTVVVYCPRASAFFGHREPPGRPHAWRAMREAGVPVALGTDGMVCLDRDDRISVLDEMSVLMACDDATMSELLPMATVHGAAALGMSPDSVRLGPALRTGLIALAVPDPDPGRTAGPGEAGNGGRTLRNAEEAGALLGRAVMEGSMPIWVAPPVDPWST